jgi:hypothetical protein
LRVKCFAEPGVERVEDFMKLSMLACALGLAVAMSGAAAWGGEDGRHSGVGVVANVKIVSDKVADVSSLEAWKKSYLKEGMTDKEKAMAVWKTVASFQHQDSPPSEHLQNEGLVYDVVKMMNVYGYSFCGVASCHMVSLAREAGLQARVRTVVNHVVPEIMWDGKWHLLDASLITYFQNAEGDVASLDEVVKGVQEWLKEHPELKGNDAGLRKFQAADGWTGWKKGPAILATGPMFDAQGWLPAKTHGWYSNVQEYDGSKNTPFDYEAGYSLGYKVNVQLRPGERLTRNWSNKGLFVNMDGGEAPGCMTMSVGQSSLRYTPKFGDVAVGRVGNGVAEYVVPVTDTTLATTALAYDNVAVQGNMLTVDSAEKPGVLTVRMPSSYVYLTGSATLDAVVADGGRIAVAFSDNNGLDWKELASFDKSGEQKIDLNKLVLRRYDYRMRVTLDGKGTGLSGLAFKHDVQHSQRALPALGQGENTITFSAGPQEGTVTIEGATGKSFNKGRNLMYTDFHPVLENIADDQLMVNGEKGSVTFDVATPGEMTRMNILTHYRARSKKGSWDVQVSTDGGQNYRSVGKAEGPTAATGKYFVVSDIPGGTKSAKVRLLGEAGGNALMMFNLRIDADYKLPGAGFAPVKVTYNWEEEGKPKSDVRVVKSASETYKITCAGKPVMKSVVVELAK